MRFNVLINLPVLISQNLIASRPLLRLIVIRVFPSGLIPIANNQPFSECLILLSSLPLSTSQYFISVSLPEIRVFPSGVKTTSCINQACPSCKTGLKSFFMPAQNFSKTIPPFSRFIVFIIHYSP